MRYGIRDDENLWARKFTSRKQGLAFLRRVRFGNPGYRFKFVRLVTKSDRLRALCQSMISIMRDAYSAHRTRAAAEVFANALKEIK